MNKLFAFIPVIFFAFSAVALETGDLRTKQPGDKVLGKSKAKVTLIEYASLSCPHCAKFHNDILPTLQKDYIDTGKVRLIFRDFPLNEPALAGSIVARCAGKQGDEKYYSMLKTLFSKQADWAFDKDFHGKLAAIAKDAGIDESALKVCLGDKEMETRILQSRKEGDDTLKVNATPFFLINGEKTEMHSVDEARSVLDAALSGKSLSQGRQEAAKKITAVRPDDRVLGQAKAKVTVVEYANIACPHCGQFHQALISMLQKDYLDTGKVKLVFRELPMTEGAFYAYMVADCKGKDGYFNTLSLLIDDTQQWVATPAFLAPLRAVAEKAGISKEAFYACLENRAAETRILNNMNEASHKLGIKHSPTVFVNGEKLDDLHSPERVRLAIDGALKTKK